MLSPLTTHNLFHTVEGWVAVGTLSLAVATGVLAIAALLTARRTRNLTEETKGIGTETNALAAETKALADLQRRALQAGVKPTLLQEPGREIEVADNKTGIVLRVRNGGGGLALLQRTRMLRLGAERPDERGGTVTATVVPPGDTTAAVFDFTGEGQRFDQFALGVFWIEVDYTDAVGEQAETALFHAERVGYADKWRVVKVEFRRAGEDKPYVSSGEKAVR